MNDKEENAAAEMRAAFQLTDEGLMAFLYGLVDTLLMGDTLKPKEGDTPQDAALKTKGRVYRDQAMKMLDRLSGLDEIGQAILDGAPMWASQNPLSAALGGAMSDGIDVAGYAAPRYVEPEDVDEDDPLVDDIRKVLETNPVLAKKVEELYGDDDTEEDER